MNTALGAPFAHAPLPAVECPHCGQVYASRAAPTGGPIRCYRCGTEFSRSIGEAQCRSELLRAARHMSLSHRPGQMASSAADGYAHTEPWGN
jgi:ribosomal protein S27E